MPAGQQGEATGAGFATVLPDLDGVLRRIPTDGEEQRVELSGAIDPTAMAGSVALPAPYSCSADHFTPCINRLSSGAHRK